MVSPDEGKLLLIYWALSSDGSDFENFVVDLFVNNETVDDDSTGADFTLGTWTGYVQINVARSDFDAPSIISHVANMTDPTSPNYTCTAGSPQTAYGWIMRGASSGTVIFGQNFNTPRLMAPGTTEELDPFTIKLKSFA